MFSAIIIENFIFSKFYGCCPFLGVSEKPDTALGMGMAVTFVITLSSAVTWIVYYGILVPLKLEYLKTIAFILVIAALVQFIEMFLRKFVPALYSALGIYLPLITTNCAVLGSALVNIQNNYNFITSVCYGFAAALGFTLAIVVFAGVRQRMEFAEPPRAFAGFPLTLIAAGLVAMAFSGFSGIHL
ncbi:MAG: RnfABCDGE type electron transport complex subunit A [Clostridia bacterium]|nr:RnfABCDGE type electron transport complex subunit A [Clostridia bacterium]MBR6603107.1 RnfABCDGE type electron transport complex subunit A [Clostridia bacterium]